MQNVLEKQNNPSTGNEYNKHPIAASLVVTLTSVI